MKKITTLIGYWQYYLENKTSFTLIFSKIASNLLPSDFLFFHIQNPAFTVLQISTSTSLYLEVSIMLIILFICVHLYINIIIL